MESLGGDLTHTVVGILLQLAEDGLVAGGGLLQVAELEVLLLASFVRGPYNIQLSTLDVVEEFLEGGEAPPARRSRVGHGWKSDIWMKRSGVEEWKEEKKCGDGWKQRAEGRH